MGHVTSQFVSVPHCCRAEGRAGHWFGQCSRGRTAAPAVTFGLIRRRCEGRVQVNITAIIGHREAKVSQNPNEFMG